MQESEYRQSNVLSLVCGLPSNANITPVLGSNPDISQKYKMGDISKGVANAQPFPKAFCDLANVKCKLGYGPITTLQRRSKKRIVHIHMNVVWKLGLKPRNSFSGNI
jgi:hypothetical protein